MKRSLLPLLLFFALSSQAQDSLTVLWNAGGAALPAPDKPDTGLQLVRSLVRVNLYAGFAVTGQEYLIRYTGKDSVTLPFHITVAGHFPNPKLEKVTMIAPDIMSLTIDGDSLATRRDSSGQAGLMTWTDHFTMSFAPGQSRTLRLRTVSRTYLSKLRDMNGSKDGNAFFFTYGDASNAWNKKTSTGQVLVKLNDVSVNNVDGLLPGSGVTGDMRHLQFGYALEIPKEDDDLLIWYQGAPPDFPFTKKVVPAKDTLYTLMDQFPIAEFGRPDFVAIDRDGFGTNSDSMIGSILYYVFFTLPWLFLFGFLIFLLRKPKKKKQTPTPDTNDSNSSI
jgi:hypothetical protein